MKSKVDVNFMFQLMIKCILITNFYIFKSFNNGEGKPIIIYNLLTTIKTQVVLRIYLITSSVVSLIEEIGFSIYSRNRVFDR